MSLLLMMFSPPLTHVHVCIYLKIEGDVYDLCMGLELHFVVFKIFLYAEFI